MKKKLKLFIKSLKRRFENKQHRAIKYRIVRSIKTYFEGSIAYGFDENDYELIKPVVAMPVYEFGIHKFDFKFKKNIVVVTVHLDRPGIFIGKGGRTIDGLKTYLSTKDYLVDLRLVETKDIWY